LTPFRRTALRGRSTLETLTGDERLRPTLIVIPDARSAIRNRLPATRGETLLHRFRVRPAMKPQPAPE
jgi:hypothetical protein